ncbi:MAG: hypothetical protein DYG98_01010 [Haliscomenobacteraceae bacterium CHB4]|nr:hypothetical protein [Saprospiraceae bacterium]MCE7921615.1 hypothetical protein [Haliscomenobacteraceae bacterium CHB4]
MQYESLLFDLKPEEIEYLIWEEELRAQGWEVYYAIDPAEIRDYCFPFGFDREEFRAITERKSKSFIADEHLLLLDLLGRPDRDRTRHVVLLKDYFEEVNGLIRYSIQQANDLPMQGEKVFQDFFFNINSDGGRDLGEYNENPEQQGTEFVQSHFSEVLASALMLRNGTEELAKLLQKGLIISENNIEGDEDLLDALAADIEDPRLEENELLIRLDNLAQNKKLQKKFSKRRDVRVIGRLITANQYFVKTNQRRLFFCFTDAEISVALLRDLFDKKDLPDYPTFGNVQAFPFFRKRRHLFAQLLCKGASETSEGVLKNLKTLQHTTKEFRAELDKSGYSEKIFFSTAARGILERYTKLRNQFENENLVRHYEKTLNEARAIAEQKNADEARALIERIQNDLPEIIKRLSGFEEQMRYLAEEHRFNVAFTRGVSDLEKRHGKFNLAKGNDPVEGSYHHLPTVFWLSNNHQHQIKSIADFVLGRNTENELSETLKTTISTLNKERAYTHEEKLIKAYIYLILPRTSPNDDNNKVSLDWVNSILQRERDSLNPDLRGEFKYLAVWAARRAKRYDDSLLFAQQEIDRLEKENNRDAKLGRFYHGRFLANYCLYDTQKEGMEPAYRKSLLTTSIEDCKSAKKLYEQLNSTMLEIRDKLQYTLLNSLCFLYTELFVEENKPEHLASARDFLLKLREPDPDNYKRFPEYLHTESYLEYHESFVPEGNILFKLNMALDAINRALNLLGPDDIDLRSKYEDLRGKITKRQQQFNR